MIIRSNIRHVIAQVQNLKRNIPVAMAQALSPQLWKDKAYAAAEEMLYALAKPEELPAVKGFLASITADAFGGEGETVGLVLRMRAVPMQLANVLAIPTSQAVRGAGSGPMDLNQLDIPFATFDDLILQWVRTPQEFGGKRRDSRDWGKSDEEVAKLIQKIMLSPQIKPGSKGWTARQALLPHILEWFKEAQAQQLPRETIALWMQVVLVRWREMIRTEYPKLVKQELRELSAT